jgi:hypothetical protein
MVKKLAKLLLEAGMTEAAVNVLDGKTSAKAAALVLYWATADAEKPALKVKLQNAGVWDLMKEA